MPTTRSKRVARRQRNAGALSVDDVDRFNHALYDIERAHLVLSLADDIDTSSEPDEHRHREMLMVTAADVLGPALSRLRQTKQALLACVEPAADGD